MFWILKSKDWTNIFSYSSSYGPPGETKNVVTAYTFVEVSVVYQNSLTLRPILPDQNEAKNRFFKGSKTHSYTLHMLLPNQENVKMKLPFSRIKDCNGTNCLAFHHTVCNTLPMISAYAENRPVPPHLSPKSPFAQVGVWLSLTTLKCLNTKYMKIFFLLLIWCYER